MLACLAAGLLLYLARWLQSLMVQPALHTASSTQQAAMEKWAFVACGWGKANADGRPVAGGSLPCAALRLSWNCTPPCIAWHDGEAVCSECSRLVREEQTEHGEEALLYASSILVARERRAESRARILRAVLTAEGCAEVKPQQVWLSRGLGLLRVKSETLGRVAVLGAVRSATQPRDRSFFFPLWIRIDRVGVCARVWGNVARVLGFWS